MGLGYVAASHFDAVLTKLEQMVKSDGGKKSSGILGFIKVRVNHHLIVLLSSQAIINVTTICSDLTMTTLNDLCYLFMFYVSHPCSIVTGGCPCLSVL